MSADRIKKTLFILLLSVLAIIWGNNIISLLPKPATEYYRTKKDASTETAKPVKEASFNFNWGYKLEANVPDPFLPFYKLAKTEVIPDTGKIEIMPEIVISQPFAYLGLIKGSKRACGVLADKAGRTYVVAPGDTLEMTKILKVNDKLVKLRYQGKEFEIELNE